MNLPGIPSLLFLAFLLVLLPWGARRTARRLRGAAPGSPVVRLQYWKSAVTAQLVMLALAWFVGAGFGFRIFAVDGLGGTAVLYGLAAFAACLALRLVSLWSRSEEELKGLSVYRRAPRTTAELTWFSVAAVAAGVAEEAAYRGVGWSILRYSLGDPWSSALILCVAFSLAHWNQGWKSLVTIFGIAAVMHALVGVTHSLVPAMLVHALYDLVVGQRIRRTARRFDETAPAEA